MPQSDHPLPDRVIRDTHTNCYVRHALYGNGREKSQRTQGVEKTVEKPKNKNSKTAKQQTKQKNQKSNMLQKEN
jgi:ribulose bisphosphate carboxylase small subunit